MSDNVDITAELRAPEPVEKHVFLEMTQKDASKLMAYLDHGFTWYDLECGDHPEPELHADGCLPDRLYAALEQAGVEAYPEFYPSAG